MINEDKVLVFDIDQTICEKKTPEKDYADLEPIQDVVEKLKEYKKNGFYIIFYTARNMRTFQGNVGKLNAVTLKKIIGWLDKHEIEYDEIHVGKPWAGKKGFYVDDRAIRPDEFVNLSYDEIKTLTGITND